MGFLGAIEGAVNGAVNVAATRRGEDRCELLESVVMFVPESEWGGLEGVNNKVDSGGGSSSVSGGDGMHCEVGENPGEGVDNALGRDFCDPDTVTQQVGASGRFKIPPVKSMWRPSAADGRLPVDEDAGGLPGGARGVRLKSKRLWTWAQAECWGLMREL